MGQATNVINFPVKQPALPQWVVEELTADRSYKNGWFDDAPEIPIPPIRRVWWKEVGRVAVTTVMVAVVLFGIMLIGALGERAV